MSGGAPPDLGLRGGWDLPPGHGIQQGVLGKRVGTDPTGILSFLRYLSGTICDARAS